MLIALIVFTLALLLLVEGIRKVRKSEKLPPGPIRWPLIGNVVEMTLANADYPHLAFAKMAEKYGDVVRLGLGVHEAVVVSSYEAMKDLLTREELCTARYEFPYVLDRAFQKNLGIIWGAHNVWSSMRKFTFKVLKDFGFGKLKSMEATFQEDMVDTVEFLKSVVEKNDGVLFMDHLLLASIPVNILWSFVGGFKFQPGDEKLEKMVKYNELAMEIYGHNNVYIAFPFLKDWFPKLSQHDHHMEMHKDSQDIFKEMMEVIKQKRTDRFDQTADNFVELFQDEIEKNAGNPDSMYTEEQLTVLLMDLFLAGAETITTSLRWAILFLILNPDVQHKVRMEIKKTLGDGPISMKDASKLPYLMATIFEVFRLGIIVPIPAGRKAMTDIYYRDFKIPKGAAVFFNIYPVLSDEKYWKDPKVFRPDRFLNDDGDKVVNTERVTLFGFGKRACPGEGFAMDFLFIFLTTLIRTFSFEAIAGHVISADNPNPGMSLAPRPYSFKVVVN